MCGRTACTLCPDDIRKACSYKEKSSSWKQPRWRSGNDGSKTKRPYVPSYNVAPGSVNPVLVSEKHFTDDEETNVEDPSFVIQPMIWGLIPSWHQGKASDFTFKTNNCRSESFASKNIFKAPANKGRRCVVLCDGYYEWKTEGKEKQPYFLHRKQDEGVVLSDAKRRSGESWDEQRGWSGPKLLMLAAIFDIWNHSLEDDEPVFSYSILTMASSSELSWLHHRMPVILESEDEVRDWLDFEAVPLTKAAGMIKHPTELQWYPVSNKVNKSTNNVHDCIVPVDLEKQSKSKGSRLMKSWLLGNKSEETKRKNDEKLSEESKRQKN